MTKSQTGAGFLAVRVTTLIVLGAGVLAAGSVPQASAQTASGTLRCSIMGGFSVVVASHRTVNCTYSRDGQSVEFYAGYTGIIGAGLGPTDTRIVDFNVFSMNPSGLAALQGDYSMSGFGSGSVTGSSLIGGRERTIALQPISDVSTTALSGLSALAGLEQLHLNYAGVMSNRAYRHRARASSADDLQ